MTMSGDLIKDKTVQCVAYSAGSGAVMALMASSMLSFSAVGNVVAMFVGACVGVYVGVYVYVEYIVTFDDYDESFS